ncbi:hypothetical protein R5W23_005856 [Gemmata sp. JC673]|uniref:Uncharacterized protein n=1 Tax=Gemmata algarum TaxID=2975278 RepID=A0ABU5ETZ7_9BACT|nr:hypothetical protein [Gemmata algarum]MDY3558714.1 hypothetical protein [Gemmata algarum]
MSARAAELGVWSAMGELRVSGSAWCPLVVGAARRREVRLGVAGGAVGTRWCGSVALRVAPAGGRRDSSPRVAVVGGPR